MTTEMKITELKLKDLQPSQFYVSAAKLAAVESWLHPEDLSGFQPIPVKMLDGRPVMTDGQTGLIWMHPKYSRCASKKEASWSFPA